MNIRKRLEHLLFLSAKDRGMGRTTMIAKAAEATGGMVLAANHDQAKMIEREFKVPTRSVEMNLDGFSGPFFFDHNATEMLLAKAMRKIDNLQETIYLQELKMEQAYEAMDAALESIKDARDFARKRAEQTNDQ